MPIDLVFKNEFYGYLYEYSIRNPIHYLKFRDSAYRGCRYIPNSRDGLRWSLVDESVDDAFGKRVQVQKQCDCFSGWRGLVACMSMGIFFQEDLSKYLCGYG